MRETAVCGFLWLLMPKSKDDEGLASYVTTVIVLLAFWASRGWVVTCVLQKFTGNELFVPRFEYNLKLWTFFKLKLYAS